MKKTLIKGTFREIKGSLNRFLAILAIIALGVSFFIGLNSVGPDLSQSAADYFAQNHFMDYRLLSTIGFDDDDVNAVKALPGIKAVQPAYSIDALETYGEQTNVAHIMSIPDTVNTLTLVEGRLPENSGECLVDKQKSGNNPKPGDIISLSSGSDTKLSDSLKVSSLKVAGVVETPAYLTKERGTSSIGNGKVSGLIFISAEDFKLQAYTEMLVTSSGTDGLDVFSEIYNDKIASLRSRLNNIAELRTKTRYDEIVRDAQSQLTDKQNDYNSSKSDADKTFADAQAKIDISRKKLNDAQYQLNTKENETNRQLTAAEVKIDQAQVQLEEKTKEYNQQLASYNQSAAAAQVQFAEAQEKIDELKSKISSLQSQLESLEEQLSQGLADGSLTQVQIDSLKQQIASLEGTINALKQQQASLEETLSAEKKQLEDAKAKLDSAKKTIDLSKVQLENQKTSLAASEKQAKLQLESQQERIDAQKESINEAYNNLEKNKAEAYDKLNAALKELNDARGKINSMAMPEWHIFQRDDNTGYADFKATVDRSNGMSSILPVIFFAIAALVCLTTMTRMVEEQRTQIGILKALGYSNGSIAFKYIFYAASASIIGIIIGMTAGFILIPSVIFKAYAILYSMPAMKIAFHTALAIRTSAIALLVITMAALFTCINELRSVPAALMLPQAPKAGKRIFLENIGFIWRHMSFSKKVTARNLLRYKKRFWMTVLGVACCCAMLLTGLGLKDSISTQVSQRQFGEILKYDMALQLKNNVTSSQIDQITDTLKNTSGAASFIENTAKNITVKSGDKSEQCNLMVPQRPDDFSKYFTLRTAGRASIKAGKPISLSDKGVVITQQLAELLKLKEGDTITIQDDDTHSHSFRVDAIAENYLMNYIFMTPGCYLKAYGQVAGTNQILAVLKPDISHDSVSASLMRMDGAASVNFISDSEQTFHEMVKSLNYVIWVIIISAVFLAFVVLYTLTAINIGERFREIATIKVLGFYDNEVSAYITRESYILSLIGIFLGLAGGVLLHGRILGTIEVSGVMFVKSILFRSFVISALLTLLFTWLVNRIAMSSLKRIDMVEALKGNE